MSYSDVVMADSPAAYWKCDEASGTTLADSSGNGHDMLLSGGATLGASGLLTAPGAEGGTSLQLDGIDGQAVLGGWPTGITDWPVTQEAWVEVEGDDAYGSVWLGDSNEGDRSFRLQVSGTRFAAAARFDSGSSPALVDVGNGKRVVHLVGVFVSDTERHLYLNGVLVGTNTDSHNFPSNAQPRTAIGVRFTDTPNSYLEGKIGHVAIYNGALSASRIKEHYLAGQRATLADRIIEQAPIAYYKLDETSGTTAADSSGNGNDGTYSGGVTLDQPPLAWSENASKAAQLDGTDGQVSVPVAPLLDGANGSAVACTIKFPDPLVAGWPMEMESAAATAGIYLRLVSSSGDLRGYIKQDSGHSAGTLTSPTGTIRPGGTHHVVLTRDNASSTTSLFVDGVLVASSDDGYTGTNAFTGDPDMVFGSRVSGTNPIEIVVDDIAIFDKALTASDAFALAERVVQKTYRDTVSALVPAVDLGMNDSSGPPVDSQGLVTLTGNATEYALTGLADSAVRYAGTDYSAGALDMGAWDGVTLHAQFKVNTHGSGSTDVILGVGSASYAFRIEGAGGSTYRVIMGSPNTIVEFTLAEDEDISVTATHDDAGNIEAFVNGQSVGTETGAQSITVNGKLTLHATPWNESAADTQDVTIDEAQVFNRVLTPAQISALHYRGTTAAEALQLAGTAMKSGVPVARLIRAHRQSDGSVIGETTSSAADGSWAIPLAAEEHCYVVARGEDEEADLVIGDVYEPPPQPELVGVETAALENGNNLTIPLPAGVQDGDLLVLVDAVKNSYRSISAAPAGFTVDSETPAGSSQTGAMFVLSKVASGETGPYTLTLDSAEYQAGALLAIRNVTQPATEGALAESYDAPSVAAASAGLLLGVYMNEDNSGAAAAITPPEGMTLQATQDSSRVELYVLSEVLGEAGDTGARTALGSGISKMSRLMFYPLAEP